MLNRYGDHYAEIKAPDLLIGLQPLSDKTIQGNNISIGFGVINFDSTVKDLESKGILFKLEQDGWIRLAYFTDKVLDQIKSSQKNQEAIQVQLDLK